MRRYIRSRIGHVYFFTLVTHDRREILTTDPARSALRAAIRSVRAERPFRLTAIVLLPDHLHAILELPVGDSDYSTRWRLIKSRFTRNWIETTGIESPITPSRRRTQERGIWQRRFYEHTCRDDADLERCINYIHFNPLKHGLVERVVDWPWSSFHRFVHLGYYPPNWGGSPERYGDDFRHPE